jgi:lipopolysaccharide transport system ATP-binding protein
MTDIALRVQNLSKCYQIYDKPHDRLKQSLYPRMLRLIGKPARQYHREFWALKDVSFEIKRGETVGIIGRNGSGKSTLLQLICGTLMPTTGSVETNGRIAALLELGSGFNSEFTGRENVRMSCALLGLSPGETEARFDDIAAFADIGDFIEQPVKTYSSGMFVRLAFAVNIVSEPDIMIVDEALAVGDMNFQAKCMTALTRIQQSGATVLFVSHDIDAVQSLCSKAMYLDHGGIIATGSAAEVAENYIRTMREESNRISTQSVTAFTGLNKVNSGQLTSGSSINFKTSEDFDARAAAFRYGSAQARITYGELLDENENEITNVTFDQEVLIRIHFRSHSDIKFTAGYFIQDKNKIPILGCWSGMLGYPQIEARDKDRFIVTYKTRLPLQDGVYSIQLELGVPLILDQLTKWIDVIDNAIVFTVSPRVPKKTWSRVFVQNSLIIQVIPECNYD